MASRMDFAVLLVAFLPLCWAQIIITEGSSVVTLLCNPAHSYPGCMSCLDGTAWGTTLGCVQSAAAPTTSAIATTSIPVTPSPSPPPSPPPPPTTLSTPVATPAPTPVSPGSSISSIAPSQVVVTTTQSQTSSFTSIIVPSVSTPSTITKATGFNSISTPSSTPITFPTTPYSGQALLVGTCTIPIYTALVMSDGGILEAPIIGCADNRPDCCPSISTFSSVPSTIPPTTSTSTVIVPVYAGTVVVSALSADPITVCPSDYNDLGSVCCPVGFSLYSQGIVGQTPCYTALPTELNTNAASAAISSITAEIAATASTGATPTISVVVITNQVFALSLPHTPHKTQVGVKIGAGVGAGAGALLVLLLLAWIYSLRKRLRRERTPRALSAAIANENAGAGSGSTPITGFNSAGMSQQPSLPSTGPSTGPSPHELPHSNYAPWAPYGSGAQQPQSGQPWQQTSGSIPSSSPGQAGTEASDEGYREMPGSQTNVYETNANLPRPGVSRMPDGRVYTEPVEMGEGRTLYIA